MRDRVKESDIGDMLMRWLESEDFDVYPEACVKASDRRADIIAVRKPLVWIIECKVSLSLQVLDQATYWLGAAHAISVAVPTRSQSIAAQRYLSLTGIGLLRVRRELSEWEKREQRAPVEEVIAPRLDRSAHRFAATRILPYLHPDMKRYRPGGTASDGYSTPWKRTMDMAVEFVARNPGATVREISDGIAHHYASPVTARTALCQWLQVEKRVQWVRTGNKLLFYPAGAEVQEPQRELVGA